MARDVDQCGLADRSHGGDHFGGKQECQCGRTGDEDRADQTHHGFARYGQSERHAKLRPDHPEADLTHLLGDRLLVAVFEVAGDHRAEDRVEAGLQLGGKRSDVLRDVIDADDVG